MEKLTTPKRLKQIKNYFSRGSWNWGNLPNSDEMVSRRFEISGDERGRINFTLGIDDAAIAEYGARVFIEYIISNHRIKIEAPSGVFDNDKSVFTVQLGPFYAKFSRQDLEYLLGFDDTGMDCDEVLDKFVRESDVVEFDPMNHF